MTRPLRIASVNVNGVRAAFRKGMGDWLQSRDVDILAMQEVRAETEHLEELLGEEWDILHDPATAKGRAGVAIASRWPATVHRVTFGADDFDSAGRWLEADYDVEGTVVSVVSCYVPSGIVDTPKQDQKWTFLDGMLVHLAALKAHNPLVRRDGRLQRGPPHPRHPQLEGQHQEVGVPARGAGLPRQDLRGRGRPRLQRRRGTRVRRRRAPLRR